MEIIRQIGRAEVLVETTEPCGLYFEESFAAKAMAEGGLVLEKGEILNLLASGDEYYPLSLHWELLDRCNFACPFCYIVGHSFNKIVRLSQIRGHLNDLVEEGLLFCTLTGGEVTIHPDFKEIYRFLKEAGVVVEVFTNGYAIDDKIVELFQSLPPAVVEVSLYSLDSQKLREIYGVRSANAASKVLENVLLMKRAGIKVVCKTFLNTITSFDVDDIVRWCQGNDIEHYSSSKITKAYDGEDLTGYEVENPKIQLSLTKLSRKAICFPCKTKNCGSAITASFSIYPCPSIKLPDCTYDLRQLGVTESLRRMKAFMRRFQDTEIQAGACGSSGCASCIAYATPVRDGSGELMHFAQS